MLGVLCTRPKPWLLTLLSFSHVTAAHQRLVGSRLRVVADGEDRPRRHHSSACRLGCESLGGAASIWHAILPAGGWHRQRPAFQHHEQKGEGSWNVAWDARPARWLHRPDSAWLLFGVCACLATPFDFPDANSEQVLATVDQIITGVGTDAAGSDSNDDASPNYKVTGVTADGRCLFRAIAHAASLRNGEEAPDENCQRELADKLRAQVVDELLRRRKETEWFIEGDFDAYVKRIQQPYVWGGEPELLMASHVLKTPISVFMIERSSDSLTKIANYGEEYQEEEEEQQQPINVLFHGYGHYDLLESISDTSFKKVEA